MTKRILACLLAAFILTSCAGDKTPTAGDKSSVAESEASSQAKPLTGEELAEKFFSVSAVTEDDLPEGALPQFDEVKAGDTIVTLTTSMGDIKLKMFPELAPKAVENFVTHCENGYYEDVVFHRIIEDFMIQGGDPKGTGTGGESIWGGKFDDELSDHLHHYRGAISMANSGTNTNGSQFFIVHSSDTITEAEVDALMFNWYYMEVTHLLREAEASGEYEPAEIQSLVDVLNAELTSIQTNGLPEEYKTRYRAAAERYIEQGGTPSLDYGYTVFGQVVEGMDVVDAIAAVEVTLSSTGEMSVPVEPVTIISATVETAK